MRRICFCAAAKKQEPRLAVISPIRRKLDALLAPNATLYSLNLCGFLLQGCTEVTGSGCSAADQVHLSKKKKSYLAEPQREVLFLAVLRMERVCNIYATSDALSALCGYVYECVCVIMWFHGSSPLPRPCPLILDLFLVFAGRPSRSKCSYNGSLPFFCLRHPISAHVFMPE